MTIFRGLELEQQETSTSRTLVTFEMRSLGTTQRGEFNRATGTVTLDSAEERGEIDILIDARSLKANTA